MTIPAGAIIGADRDGNPAYYDPATDSIVRIEPGDLVGPPSPPPSAPPSPAGPPNFPPPDCGPTQHAEWRLTADGQGFYECVDNAPAGTLPPVGPQGPPGGGAVPPIGPVGPGGPVPPPGAPGGLPGSLQRWWDELQASILEAVHGATTGVESVWRDLQQAVSILAKDATTLPERIAADVAKKIGSSVGLAVPNLLSLIGAALGGTESLVAAILSSVGDTDDLAASIVGAVKGEQDGAGEWLIGVLSHIVRANTKDAIAAVGDRPITPPPAMTGAAAPGEELPPELPIAVGPTFDPTSLLNPLARTLALMLGIIEGALAVGHPGADAIEQMAWELNPVKLPDPGSVIGGEVRGFIGRETAEVLSKRHGYDTPAHSLLRELARTRPGTGDLLTAYFRGALDEPELDRGLLRLGFDPRARELVFAAAVSIADPGTIARAADRGYFDPNVPDLFQGDQELTDELRAALFRHGYNADEALTLWRGHWRPLDPALAQEAIHRGFLAPEAYPTVLRAAGLAPFAREVAEKVLYGVYSRRDLLRLVKAGLLDHAGLVAAWRDLGYDQAHAEVLAQLFEQLAETDTKAEHDRIRGKLRDVAIGLFEGGALTDEALRARLVALGITEEEAVAETSLAALRVHAKELDTVAKLVRPFYVSGVWDIARTGQELYDRDVPGPMIQTLINRWDLERLYAELKPEHQAARDLTKGELTDAFIARSLAEPALRSHLSAMGYDPDEVNTLVTLALIRQHKDDLHEAEAVIEHKVKAGQLAEGDASAALDKLGVLPGARDRLLDGWYKQKAQLHSELTFGQISDMAKAGLIDEEQADELLHRLPYADEERALLLALLGYKVAQAELRAKQAADKAAAAAGKAVATTKK